MTKLCKICNSKPVNQYSITAVCGDKCYTEYKRRKQEQKEQSKLVAKTLVDNRKKNETRHISEIVKRRVFERDNGCCVLCGTTNDLENNPHHIFYGPEAEYTSDRNHANKLVTICRSCHYAIHSKGDTDKRNKCKEYIEEYYKNQPYRH